jgi:hypothetical protein
VTSFVSSVLCPLRRWPASYPNNPSYMEGEGGKMMIFLLSLGKEMQGPIWKITKAKKGHGIASVLQALGLQLKPQYHQKQHEKSGASVFHYLKLVYKQIQGCKFTLQVNVLARVSSILVRICLNSGPVIRICPQGKTSKR